MVPEDESRRVRKGRSSGSEERQWSQRDAFAGSRGGDGPDASVELIMTELLKPLTLEDPSHQLCR